MADRDWRLPENRLEAFQRFYTFHLEYRTHPGCVYQMLPWIADTMDLDDDQRAWLVWLNGNTQNVVTSLLLLEAAPTPHDWMEAVDFWNENFKALEWDTDRRHQKSKFGEATAKWYLGLRTRFADGWLVNGERGWEETWDYSFGQPYMGRLSAWSMYEYARILFGADRIPDIGSFMMHDRSGSRSHRNGAALVAGYDSTFWDAETPFLLGIVDEIDAYAEGLLSEAYSRNLEPTCACPPPYLSCMHDPVPHPDVSRLTLESALCTYKSWHKPNRRYPNVYADMFYNRIRRAEARFDRTLGIFWEARQTFLPEHLRLEDCPTDPGLAPVKQNYYLETGHPIMMSGMYPDMANDFDAAVLRGDFGIRKDPK